MINISSVKLYDEQAAYSHVKNLAFARQAATEGETKCLNYILQKLKKEKIKTSIEPFEWTKTSTITIKIAFIYIFVYMLIYHIILLFPGITWIILILDIIFVIVIYLGVNYLFDSTQIHYIGKRKESKNIITTFQAKDIYPKRPVIIFSAHHDTASSRFSMTMTINLYKFGALLLLAFLVLTFILSIWSVLTLFKLAQINEIFLVIRNVSLGFGITLLSINFIILFNKKLNKSIGSIDNASGVAVLLELAKIIKKNPLERTDVIFLWCGAEEMGLWGSRQYCKKHIEELIYDYDLDKSYNINIDMVGTYIGLLDKLGLYKKKNLNQNLNDVLKSSANQQKISLKKESIKIGAGSSDHTIFRAYAKEKEKKGFQVTSFTSDKDTKFIHSLKDSPEKCSVNNLNGCIEICYNTIKSLDLRVE